MLLLLYKQARYYFSLVIKIHMIKAYNKNANGNIRMVTGVI